ncbi:MAG: hypothetical protein KBT36_04360 [Kurthia sp.]|uniref:Uncharacterized protein n=1 Tax=Faecalibacter rhinopitheci TaxID=2779678 RepID=A0A8J7FP91_9FLAO|nr:DUF6266 family protein [Faecalibacter rhinopitheci]MBF0596814.1 hypothetical protein [Faecalibacter rhinopitheci]MBQ0138508.1 hypothetical protein [Candidatus Kurthia equi]
MGKITDSLLSGTRGRTGRIVVSNIQGHEISRMRPRKTARTATPKQQLVKERFNFAVKFIQGYKTVVKEYYGKRVGLKSPYNVAMSNLLKSIKLDVTDLTFSVNHEEIMFTKGNLLEPQPSSITSDDPLTVNVNWMDNSTDTLDENDILYVMYAEENQDKLLSTVVKTTALRKDESVAFQLLPKFQGVDLHIWVSFVNPILQEASNSIYLGLVTVT